MPYLLLLEIELLAVDRDVLDFVIFWLFSIGIWLFSIGIWLFSIGIGVLEIVEKGKTPVLEIVTFWLFSIEIGGLE